LEKWGRSTFGETKWKSHERYKIKKINKNTFKEKDVLKNYKQVEGRKTAKRKKRQNLRIRGKTICCVFERENHRPSGVPIPSLGEKKRVNEQNNTTE